MEQLYGGGGGPGTIYSNYLQKMTPGGATGDYLNFAERQQGAYEDIFEQMRGLGDIGRPGTTHPEQQTFDDFLGKQGQIGRPTAGAMMEFNKRTADLLAGPAPTAEDIFDPSGAAIKDPRVAFYEKYTQGEPGAGGFGSAQRHQFSLALKAAMQNVPDNLRGYLARSAERIFDKWMANRDPNAPASQGFLNQFVGGGSKLSGVQNATPSPNNTFFP
jgi:hypothetical protein